MSTKQTGNLGEKIAKDFLKRKGYRILDKNYSFRIPGNPQKGEIDIIAKKEDGIIFVEVKTLINNRERASAFLPEDKVNFSKQKKLIKTAESWLMKNKIPLNSKWQIDVVSVSIEEDFKKAKISHFINAFC